MGKLGQLKLVYHAKTLFCIEVQRRGSTQNARMELPVPDFQKLKPSAQTYSARQNLLPASSIVIPRELSMQIGITLAN
jgi:hypothetical protein